MKDQESQVVKGENKEPNNAVNKNEFCQLHCERDVWSGILFSAFLWS